MKIYRVFQLAGICAMGVLVSGCPTVTGPILELQEGPASSVTTTVNQPQSAFAFGDLAPTVEVSCGRQQMTQSIDATLASSGMSFPVSIHPESSGRICDVAFSFAALPWMTLEPIFSDAQVDFVNTTYLGSTSLVGTGGRIKVKRYAVAVMPTIAVDPFTFAVGPVFGRSQTDATIGTTATLTTWSSVNGIRGKVGYRVPRTPLKITFGFDSIETGEFQTPEAFGGVVTSQPIRSTAIKAGIAVDTAELFRMVSPSPSLKF